jgi:NAD(P)H-binding
MSPRHSAYDAINILQRLPFKLFLKNAYDDKSIQESLVAESELDWLIVRPGILMNCPSSGNDSVLARPSERRHGLVARVDVADCIVKRIEADTFNREEPVIIRYPL